jgi:hypothetical protein
LPKNISNPFRVKHRDYLPARKIDRVEKHLRGCFKGLINLYIRPPPPQDGGLKNGSRSPILGDLGGECKALKLFKQSLKPFQGLKKDSIMYGCLRSSRIVRGKKSYNQQGIATSVAKEGES